MKLLTKAHLDAFERIGKQDGAEAKVVVKFFTPWSGWTWYATEWFPEDRVFFGYVRGFEEEYGYFSLDELESVEGPAGLKVERDMYYPIAEYDIADVQNKVGAAL